MVSLVPSAGFTFFLGFGGGPSIAASNLRRLSAIFSRSDLGFTTGLSAITTSSYKAPPPSRGASLGATLLDGCDGLQESNAFWTQDHEAVVPLD